MPNGRGKTNARVRRYPKRFTPIFRGVTSSPKRYSGTRVQRQPAFVNNRQAIGTNTPANRGSSRAYRNSSKSARQQAVSRSRAIAKSLKTTGAKSLITASHGNQSLPPPPNAGGTNKLAVSISISKTVCYRFACYIVAHACNYSGDGDGSTTINSAWVARFLGNYLYEEWNGIVHDRILTLAPWVFWDLCDAGKRKTAHGFTYRFDFDTITEPSGDYWVPDTCGAILGAKAADASGYSIVEPTLTGWDADIALEETSILFSRVVKELDCVNYCDYTHPLLDDVSIFHESQSMPNTDANYFGYGISILKAASNPSSDQEVFSPIVHRYVTKPKCKWLARLPTFVGTSSTALGTGAQGGHHTLLSYTTGSQILVHRMLHGLRGYHRHSDEVFIRPLRFSSFFNSITAYADAVNNVTAPALNIPFDLDISITDAKFMIYNWLQSHVKTWCAGSMDHWCRFSNGDTSQRFMGGGAFCGNTIIWNTMQMYAPFQKSLSRIYPQNVGKRYYYPQIFMDARTLNGSGTTWEVLANGTLTTDFSSSTLVVGAGTDWCTTGTNPSLDALFTKWRKFMTNSQIYTPVCNKLPYSNKKMTLVSWVCRNNATSPIVYYMISPSKLTIEDQNIAIATILPENYISASSEDSLTSSSTAIQTINSCNHREWYAVNTASVNVQETYVIQSLIHAIHDKYNKGAPEAETTKTPDTSGESWSTTIFPVLGGVVAAFPSVANFVGRSLIGPRDEIPAIFRDEGLPPRRERFNNIPGRYHGYAGF